MTTINIKHEDSFSLLFTARIVIFLAVLLGAWHIYAHWVVVFDDAYITLRYAYNAYHGHGIVFNPGTTPIEGYSNFSFFVIAYLAFYLNLPALLTIKILSLITFYCSLYFVYQLAKIFSHALFASLACLVFVSLPPMLIWSTSGLELMPYTCLTLGSLYYFFTAIASQKKKDRVKASITSSLLAFAVAITRPEGAILFFSLILTLLIKIIAQTNVNQKKFLTQIFFIHFVIFTIPYGTYFLWHYIYFGKLFAQTVYCKSLSVGAWDVDYEPWFLIKRFIHFSYIFIVFSFGSLLFTRDWRKWSLALYVFLSVIIFYNADPVIGSEQHYFIPAISILLILSASFLDYWFHYAKPLAYGSFIITVSLILLLQPAIQKILSNNVENYTSKIKARELLANYIKNSVEANQTVLVGDVGLISYKLPDYKIEDTFCLNSQYFLNISKQSSVSDYYEYVLNHLKPAAIIIKSSERSVCQPANYMDHKKITHVAAFTENYQLEKTFQTDRVDATYFVFLRKIANQKK